MAVSFSQQILDDISVRLDLVAVISEFIPLKKAGKDYKGCCPFHSEKTPSFTVSPDKGLYYCFGCGEGGNLFSFIMKMESLTFPEAVTVLARKAGVDLSRLTKNQGPSNDERETYFKINQYAAWFYTDKLKGLQGSDARRYLEGRGVSPAIGEEFQIGYAPDAWDSLFLFLKEKRVPLAHAERLGLIRRKKDGGYYDFFRNRIVFPIVDFESRVIGFGGRRMGDQKASDEAKYLNSPESPVYHKGVSVYGLLQAKKAMKEANEVILVEGYMDVIGLAQAGIRNAVAPLGTALTEAQVKILSRHAKKFVLMFDGDRAGEGAFLKAVPLFLKSGYHPAVFPLPPGEDPDSYARKKGAVEIADEIRKSLPAIDRILIESLQEAGSRTPDRLAAARKVMTFVSVLPQELERRSYVSRVAQFLGVGEDVVLGSMAREAPKGTGFASVSGGRKNSLERILASLYVRFPREFEGVVPDDIFSKFEDQEIGKMASVCRRHFRETGRSDWGSLGEWQAVMEDSLLRDLLFAGDEMGEEKARQAILDSLDKWRRDGVKRELKRLTGAITAAEMAHDNEEVKRLLTEKQETVRMMKSDRLPAADS